MENTENQQRQIAETNDQVRQTLFRDRLIITNGIQCLSQDTQNKIFTAIESYEEFQESNDPHKEHDFGALEVDGNSMFWKIDYFDNELEYHTPDVLDRSVTRRVLTVMLAEECAPGKLACSSEVEDFTFLYHAGCRLSRQVRCTMRL